MAKLDCLTREALVDLYEQQKKSLQDIARLFNVSRVAVYKRLKFYGIAQRTKSQARLEAQKQLKLPQRYYAIHEEFFSSWTREMAYVLGLIITDGNVSKNGTISLCMNDEELLVAVKRVLGSEHPIERSKHQEGLFNFHFSRERMVVDLARLGVVPRKSLVVDFPAVPQQFLADFIRGVFDGDGSVFTAKNGKIRANFVSGSKEFMAGLGVSLRSLGLPERTIYRQKTKNGYSYSIVYDHENCRFLYEILYKDCGDALFLRRKYSRFQAVFGGGV